MEVRRRHCLPHKVWILCVTCIWLFGLERETFLSANTWSVLATSGEGQVNKERLPQTCPETWVDEVNATYKEELKVACSTEKLPHDNDRTQGSSLGGQLIDFEVAAVRQRCDFPVVDGRNLSATEFYDTHIRQGLPALIRNAMRDRHSEEPWPAFRHWQFNNLASFFQGVSFRVGPGPYPSEELTVGEFLSLATTLRRQQRQGKGYAAEELPTIFQYGEVPTSWIVWGHTFPCVPRIAFFHPKSQPMHRNATLLCDKILGQVQVPRFIIHEHLTRKKGVELPPLMITHSGFLVGFEGSGIDFHEHQDAINLLFHGEKRWFMKVPRLVAEEHSLRSTCEAVNYNKQVISPVVAEVCTAEKRGASGVGRFAELLSTSQVTETFDASRKVLTCLQRPGEIVYIPDNYPHAVLNTEPSVAMQMQWYSGDWKNYRVRRFLQQHLLHALDKAELDPDSFTTMDSFFEALNWNK